MSKARFVLGAALLIGGFLSPLLIPFVTQSNLPGGWKAVLSTGLVAGLPELGMLLAVAVLGKEGFALLKQKLFSLLRRHTEPSAVSATRYRIGLVLFCLPLAIGWAMPYAIHFLPALATDSLWPAILPDVAFLFSFLVLGADFWEKIRQLFIYRPATAGRGAHPGDEQI